MSGDQVLATSKTIHVATKGGKVGNPKRVTVNNSIENGKGSQSRLPFLPVNVSEGSADPDDVKNFMFEDRQLVKP